ncbi:MAG: Multidrug resistance protein MdtA [Gammaproteobacteria bacterium]|nr:Multidrug resistance protein MdtA [Gammaproteobacteria bacterium]
MSRMGISFTGLLLVITIIGTLSLLEYSGTVASILSGAGKSTIPTAVAEGSPVASEDDDRETDSGDGWSMETPPANDEGAASAVKAAGDTCCPPGAKNPTCEVGGLFDPSKIEQYKASGDWCTPHGVPESMCVKCNPNLVVQFKEKGNWCAGHELPESLCPLCHKELAEAGVGRDWCSAHGLPASQCIICKNRSKQSTGENGLVSSLQNQVAEMALELVPSGDGGTDSKISAASGIGQRVSINPNCLLHLAKIRLASPEIAESAGLQVESAQAADRNRTVDCYGEVQFDKTKYALISPRSGGIVRTVEVDLGRAVKRGDVLANVDSIEFGRAKADYLRAWTEYERWTWMDESFDRAISVGGIALKEKVEAKSSLDAASVEIAIAAQDLRNYGLESEDIERIKLTNDTRTDLPVRAPFDGTVVELNAVVGERVVAGDPLCSVADLTSVWVVVDVSASDLPMLALGSSLTFRPDSLIGETFTGTVTWISPKLDERTRTAKARMEIQNTDGLLRAGQFGRGSIQEEEFPDAIVVPREAVQWDGCCNVIFVEESQGVYETRKLRVGSETETERVILTGLVPGERVVTTGSYLLKTEILKGSIGAGCCGND